MKYSTQYKFAEIFFHMILTPTQTSKWRCPYSSFDGSFYYLLELEIWNDQFLIGMTNY